jgi:hypothetical protein
VGIPAGISKGCGKGGKRHSHQCLIPRRLLEIAEERLQAAANRLARAPDFDALHGIVQSQIESVRGIGKLMVYDIAHRIGAYLRKEPTLVYLHRGTKEGAAILGFRGETLDPANLPVGVQTTEARRDRGLPLHILRTSSGVLRRNLITTPDVLLQERHGAFVCDLRVSITR